MDGITSSFCWSISFWYRVFQHIANNEMFHKNRLARADINGAIFSFFFSFRRNCQSLQATVQFVFVRVKMKCCFTWRNQSYSRVCHLWRNNVQPEDCGNRHIERIRRATYDPKRSAKTFPIWLDHSQHTSWSFWLIIYTKMFCFRFSRASPNVQCQLPVSNIDGNSRHQNNQKTRALLALLLCLFPHYSEYDSRVFLRKVQRK